MKNTLLPALAACCILAGCALERQPPALPADAAAGMTTTGPDAAAAAAAIEEPVAVVKPPEPRRPPPAAAPARSGSDTLLEYFQRIRKFTATRLTKEYESVQQSHARSQNDFDRVRLAMILSIPGTAFNSESKALKLLEPLAGDADRPLQGLAYLITNQLQERLRLDAAAQDLQQKIEALRSLERSLIERPR